MIDWFTHWNYAPAECWQFWMPQSGGLGGIVMGLLIVICIFLIRS